MKMKTIQFNGKEIKITRDGILNVTGISLIVFSVILLGLFAWVTFIFEGNLDKNFWINYAITMCAILLGFFGMLITRITSERKKPAYIITKQKLKNRRTAITKSKQINQMKYWLKWVYNYTKRVEKLHDYIINMQEKLRVYEKPTDDLKEVNLKVYERLLKKYKKYIEKKDKLENYLKAVATHYDIIDAYKKDNKELVKELKATLEHDLLPKVIKKVQNVTYSKLFSGTFSTKEDEPIYVNYISLILQNILPKVLIGAGITLLFTSMIPEFLGFDFATVLSLFMKLTGLVGYLFLAVIMAMNIATKENQADENKLMICETFGEDYGLFKETTWQEIDETENTDEQYDNDNTVDSFGDNNDTE